MTYIVCSFNPWGQGGQFHGLAVKMHLFLPILCSFSALGHSLPCSVADSKWHEAHTALSVHAGESGSSHLGFLFLPQPSHIGVRATIQAGNLHLGFATAFIAFKKS